MIYDNILDLVGHTPVLKYKTINKNDIYLKLEMFNPAGSVKDRIALSMILDLKAKNKINSTTPIVEATSGNTGIGLSFVLATMGLHPCIFLPENMSKERIDAMKVYGAQIFLTPASEGMTGATKMAKKYAKEHDGIYINQFANKNNIKAHKMQTAKEIKKDFKNLDVIIAGVGTAGTITGLGLGLKKHYKNLALIGVEPSESAMLSESKSGKHGIQGIGAGFVPPLYKKELVDSITKVSTEETRKKAKSLAQSGLFLGLSSSAAIIAAEKYAAEHQEKTILVICPDNGSKYISLGVYENE